MTRLSLCSANALLVAIAFSLASAGCDTQAPTDYRGEPLVVVRGTVVAASTEQPAAAPPPLAAAIVWRHLTFGTNEGIATNTDARIATSAPVTGSFPAEFQLAIFTPPPDDVLVGVHPGDPSRPGRVGWGAITAIRADADRGDVRFSDTFGWAEDASVLYADTDIPAGTFVGAYFVEGPIPAGYHLLIPRPRTELDAENAAYEKCFWEHVCRQESPGPCEVDTRPRQIMSPEGFARRITLAVSSSPGIDPPPAPAGPPAEPEPPPPSPPPGDDAGAGESPCPPPQTP